MPGTRRRDRLGCGWQDLPNQHGTRLSTAELDYQNQQVLFTTTHLNLGRQGSWDSFAVSKQVQEMEAFAINSTVPEFAVGHYYGRIGTTSAGIRPMRP
jgi:hypothetical protein